MPTSFAALSLDEFLAALGDKSPTPGGGAVASVVGALAAALGRMVVAYSVGKKSLAAHQPELERAQTILTLSTSLMLQLAEDDARAYSILNELNRLPETDPTRQQHFPAALNAAIAAPRAILGASCDLLKLLERLQPITNTHLRSDLAIAAILSQAAAKSAWCNIHINLPLLASADEREQLIAEGQSLLTDASQRCERLENACR